MASLKFANKESTAAAGWRPLENSRKQRLIALEGERGFSPLHQDGASFPGAIAALPDGAAAPFAGLRESGINSFAQRMNALQAAVVARCSRPENRKR